MFFCYSKLYGVMYTENMHKRKVVVMSTGGRGFEPWKQYLIEMQVKTANNKFLSSDSSSNPAYNENLIHQTAFYVHKKYA